MIVFKDFFVSVCPGLRILLKADKEKKKTGKEEEEKKKKKKSETEKLFC